ncbi:SPW repeat protein [Allosaccharopolyspora coralli]|uniref:SPW repeat protein n=1 Tax=Allosaccharopolyspora coralli TaxID=2665642 RepID=UPI001E29143B|nr:SPW repeat protein [Allosaccharopolyspora coralli]
MARRANDVKSQPWIRWQDWAAVALGVYLMLATLWTTTTGSALSTMLVLGALLVVAAVWSLAMPGSMASEYAHMAIGVLLFISPWVLGYSALAGAAWTSWVVGILAVIAGGAALPEATAAHRGGMASSH